MKTHKDLQVWKDGIELVKTIYQMTSQFPKDEMYGIVSQMRRAAVSIPANISEGAARNGNKEYIHFLYISLGSLSELETLLIISSELDFLRINDLMVRVENIRKKLLNLIKYLKNK